MDVETIIFPADQKSKNNFFLFTFPSLLGIRYLNQAGLSPDKISFSLFLSCWVFFVAAAAGLTPDKTSHFSFLAGYSLFKPRKICVLTKPSHFSLLDGYWVLILSYFLSPDVCSSEYRYICPMFFQKHPFSPLLALPAFLFLASARLQRAQPAVRSIQLLQ